MPEPLVSSTNRGAGAATDGALDASSRCAHTSTAPASATAMVPVTNQRRRADPERLGASEAAAGGSSDTDELNHIRVAARLRPRCRTGHRAVL